MKRTILCVLLVTMAFIAACGSPSPVPATQAPASTTAAPSAAATQPAASTSTLVPTNAPPTSEVTATVTPVPDAVVKLTGSAWQWVKSTDNSSKVTTVNQPSKYTLQFSLSDGTVEIKADCNNASGTFTADAHNLSITLGPSTLAACSAGSLSDQYLKELGEVQTYLFEGDNLIMGRTDNGSMHFTPVGPVATPASTVKPHAVATLAPKPATTLDFIADLVGCRNAPTADKPGGIVLLFRFEPTGAPGPYRYFDMDEDKEVPKLYERPASKGSGVIVTWAVQAGDGQYLEKKQNYAASKFAEFGCQ